MKKLISSFLMTLLMVMTLALPVLAAGPALNKQSVKLGVGASEVLSLENTGGGIVFWTTSNEAVATVDDGVVTAKGAGKCTISAINNGKSYKCTVTVKKTVFKTKSLKIYKGDTGAIILEGAEIASAVSDKPEIATVSGNGIVTGVKAGKAVVKVTDKNGKNYECKVTVAVELNKKSLKLTREDKYQLILLGDKIASAKSSKPQVATVDDAGNILAVSSGKTTITVVDSAGKSYKCEVKVAVSLNKSKVTLYKGEYFDLELKGDTIVSAKSKKTSVATVTNTGKIYAYGVGKTTITVKSASGKKYKCKVVSKVGVSDKSITVPCGKTAQITLKGGYITTVDSSKKSIATVSKYDSKTVNIIAGTKPGKTTVTLMYNRKKYKCTVTVIPTLESDKLMTHINESNKIKVIGDTIVSAKSSDNEVLKTNAIGEVTGVKKGKTVVELKGISKRKYYCLVTVNEPLSVILTVDQGEVISDSYTNLVFNAMTSESVDSVMLYKVSGAGEKTLLTEMKDDGRYSSNGDELSNDLIYTCKESLKPDDLNDMKFTATAVIDGTEKSAETSVKVIKAFTTAEINAMLNVDSELDAVLGGFDSDTTEEAKQSAAETKLSELASGAAPKIKNVSSYDENTGLYTFEYSSTGVLGGLLIKDIDSETANGDIIIDTVDELIEDATIESEATEIIVEDAAETVDEELSADGAMDAALMAAPARDASQSGRLSALAVSAEGDDAILDASAMLTDVTFYYAFDKIYSSGRYPNYTKKQEEWKNKGVNVTIDKDVTITDLKNLDSQISVFSMHGALYNGIPALCTLDPVTYNNNKAYNLDLAKNRIVAVTSSGANEYWVLPKFFEENYTEDALDEKVILSETCKFFGKEGNVRNEMATALTSRGAEAVLGFHNSVYADYSRDMIYGWCEGLFDGKTIGTALSETKQKYGANDGHETNAAYPILRGDENFALFSDALENGGFELSNKPIKWNPQGDARVISSLGPIEAPQGTRMGFITTGIGSLETKYKGTEGSVLSQSFKIPMDATTLAFTYNVVSEEPMEYVNSIFDDKFYANLYAKSGNLIDELATETINTATWYKVEDIDFDGGDSTTYQTNWKNITYDVSGLRGQVVTLEFTVFDVGDSIYDTAALIDKVKLY